MSGPTPSPTARRPTTGCRSSAARPGSGTRAAQQYYLHNFLAEQPDLNFHNPRGAGRAARRRCASGWSAASTASGSTPSTSTSTTQGCADNPPLPAERAQRPTAPAVNPYNYQEHLYDKSQPENLGFLEALPRAARRVSGDAPRSARSATRSAALRDRWPPTPPAATSCTCATPSTCSAPASSRAAHVRRCVEAFETRRADGWVVLGLLQPRRRCATSAAGRRTAATGRAVARLASALLLSLRGSVCLYQGEELGLTEAELAFEDLQRSLRHPLLAGIQGPRRLPHADGLGGAAPQWRLLRPASPGCRCRRSICRTPSTCSRATTSSLLEHYRRLLAFRRAHPALAKGDIEFLESRGRHRRLHPPRRQRADRLRLQSRSEPAVTIWPRQHRCSPGRARIFGQTSAGTIRLGGYGAWFGRID